MKHYEIENKYLIKRAKALKFLKNINRKKNHIEQIYIKYGKNSIKRIRKLNKRYILTVKKGRGRIKEEYEKEISKKRYKKLSKKRIGYPIKKDRYVFFLKDKKYELDIFKKRFKGLAFLEIEFKNKKELLSYKPPKILKRFIIKDVSDERDYSNADLALKKYEDNDISKLKNNKKALKKKLKSKNLNIASLLYIKLYINLQDIKKSFLLYRNTSEKNSLSKLKTALKKTKSTIKVFKKYIPSNIYDKLQTVLKEALKEPKNTDKAIFDIQNFADNLDFYLLPLAKLPPKKRLKDQIITF
ncbi:MAG: hypothetical protein GXO12_06155 [Epsilonproteobacteria bacterium]|nr:hypothetical protein [Campylobacterota bacterium]